MAIVEPAPEAVGAYSATATSGHLRGELLSNRLNVWNTGLTVFFSEFSVSIPSYRV
jgi:hypothetical protein